MSDLFPITAKLVPYPKRGKVIPGFASAYHFEPEPQQSQALGNLFLAIEVLGSTKSAEEVAALVCQTLTHTFFNHAEDKPAEEAFEESVRAVNEALSAYTSRGNSGWVGKMSAVIALLSGEELHLTQTGGAEGYLIRHGKTSHISQGLGSKEPYRPIKTFGQIASGQVETGDKLILATPAVLHQLSQQEITDIIIDNPPADAVKKIHERVGDHSGSDRIAATVVEVTTAALAAMQPLPTEPMERRVGEPDNVLENAKQAALPVARQAGKTAVSLGQSAAGHYRTKVLPGIRQSLIWLISKIRKWLRTPGSGKKLLAGIVIVAVVLGWWWHHSTSGGQLKSLQAKYDGALKQEQQAELDLGEGNRNDAAKLLTSAQATTSSLAKDKRSKALEASLKKRHQNGDPASIKLLQQKIAAELDRAQLLIKVSASSVLTLNQLKNPVHHFELVGSSLVAADDKGNLLVANTSGGKTRTIDAPKDFGKLQTTAVSSNNDGIYLVTDEPSVWFYHLEDDQYTRQSIAFGSWPKAKAAGTYSGNLYLLADDDSQIYKHGKTLSGFTGSINYLSKDQADSLNGASALAIDGSIYTAGGNNVVKRYLAGSLKQSASGLPDSLSSPIALEALGDQSLLVMTDGKSHRIGLLNSDQLSLISQYELTGGGNVLAAHYDPKAKQLFALTDGKIVKAETLP